MWKKHLVLTTALIAIFSVCANNQIGKIVDKFMAEGTNKQDIKELSKETKEVTLTFKVAREENYNEEAWENIISLVSELIILPDKDKNGEETVELLDLKLEKLHEFGKKIIEFCGSKNNLPAEFTIGLNNPEEE